MRIAFYPGSFDPVTNGHMDVLMRAYAVADKVVVGIGVHPGKSPLFTFSEREEMLRRAVEAHGVAPELFEVVSFQNLVAIAALEHGAKVLIRGLRDGTDLDYEMQMAGMNLTLAPELSTIFVPASPASRHITATLVRQIAKLGGDVSAFAPAHVADALHARASG